jgi:hypothetical protein
LTIVTSSFYVGYRRSGATRVRVIAAEEGRSMSATVTDRLESLVRERKAFERARLRKALDLHWTPPPAIQAAPDT